MEQPPTPSWVSVLSTVFDDEDKEFRALKKASREWCERNWTEDQKEMRRQTCRDFYGEDCNTSIPEDISRQIKLMREALEVQAVEYQTECKRRQLRNAYAQELGISPEQVTSDMMMYLAPLIPETATQEDHEARIKILKGLL